MTEINDMKPGPELDALVAERVMGLVEGVDGWAAFTSSVCNPEEGGVVQDICFPLRPYSTDIAAAWEVVEKMNKQPRNICVSHSPVTDRWLCQILSYRREDGTFWCGEGGSAESLTAPEAICKAALMALEGESQ